MPDLLLDVELVGDEGEEAFAARNMSTDPLTFMFRRGVIDEYQYAVGQALAGHFHRSMISGSGAIDYSKPQVDNSFNPHAADHAERSHDAIVILAKVRERVGEPGYGLLRQICHEGVSMTDAAQECLGGAKGSRSVVIKAREAIKSALDDAGSILGLST